MTTNGKIRRSFWPAAGSAITLVAGFAFILDVTAERWIAWVLAPLFGAGLFALSLTRGATPTHAFLWLAGLTLAAFVTIYALLDIVIGPDRPLWFITPPLVLALWCAAWFLASLIDD